MDLLLLPFLFLAEISNHMYQLKTLGIQMEYPIGVLVWVVIKVNDKTVFDQFWRVKKFQLVYQFSIYTSVVLYKKIANFLRSFTIKSVITK